MRVWGEAWSEYTGSSASVQGKVEDEGQSEVEAMLKFSEGDWDENDESQEGQEGQQGGGLRRILNQSRFVSSWPYREGVESVSVRRRTPIACCSDWIYWWERPSAKRR